jgi:hypothetical protein
MPDGIDPGFDSAMVGSADWPGVIVNLANQGSTITLLVAVLTLGILLVMALQPAHGRVVTAPVVATREGLTAAWLAGGTAMTMTVAGAGTAVATLPAPVELLQASGLTPTDVLALTGLRERVQRGRVAEEATLDERLSFARWLAERGKIGQ